MRRKQSGQLEADAGVRCRIGGISVKLRSELPQVMTDFMALYPVQTPEPDAAERTIQIEVRRSGRSRFGRRLYRVFADGAEVGGQRHSEGVFPVVEWAINLRVIATRPEYLQVHAASMAYRGQGFIFAGESGCGKSTLAAILLARQWRYLCDEFALVDVNNLALHPFPKALCIKAGSYPVLRRLGLSFARSRDHVKELKGRVAYINPGAHDSVGNVAAVPSRYIVFPVYRSGAKPRMEEIPRPSAVMELYRSCFNRHAFADAGLPLLTRLVTEARCFRLETGEPAETGQLLESLVTASASIHAPARHRRLNAPSLAFADQNRWRSRREVLRLGVKLAYVAPAVVTLSAKDAFAAASNPSGICSNLLVTGASCNTDDECCSNDCDLGTCR